MTPIQNLRLQVSKAEAEAEICLRAAQAAKGAYKRVRKEHKAAKKQAKQARKQLKALNEELKTAMLKARKTRSAASRKKVKLTPLFVPKSSGRRARVRAVSSGNEGEGERSPPGDPPSVAISASNTANEVQERPEPAT